MQSPLALFFLVCLAPEATVTAHDDPPIEQAVKLANQGNVDGALELLRNHLKTDAKDVPARNVLGHIFDFDGRPDEAVAIWEAGLSGEPSDFPLLMAIAEIRRRQGSDGPTISYHRGTVRADPGKNEAEEEKYKRAHLALSATTYEKGAKLRPRDPEAASALGAVYSAQGKHDAAAEVWKSLVELEPKTGEFRLNLGLALKQAGQADLAAQHLKEAIALEPRLAEAHEAIAEIFKSKGETALAEQSTKHAEFYKSLPSFSTLTFSDDNVKTLESLSQPQAVQKLIADPSDRAAQFLAVVCWSHPHNQLETQAFDSLDARGAKTTALVRSLLEGARSTCTIKSAAHILARRKAEGLLEYLVRVLPGDTRGFAMDMDIAGSLDELGDPRAVTALVQMLNPEDTDPNHDSGPSPLADRYSARARAALALGAFDTPEARSALEAGTKIPQFAAYCWAALFRLSKDPKHLEALEKAVKPNDGFTSAVVGRYLEKKAATHESKELAQTWERQREAQQAAAAAANQKLNAGKKSKLKNPVVQPPR